MNYWEGKFRELEVSENVTKVFKKIVDNTNEKLTSNDVESLKKELKNIEIKDIKNDVKDVKNIVTFVEDAFKFEYVGIIALQIEDNLYIIKCYPKYYKYYKDVESDKTDADFNQILKVINKYNSKYRMDFYDIYHDGEKNFNKLEASLYIINDYLINGLYSNQHEEIEQNGEGEILWDKTINKNIAVIKDNKPYYLDFFTKNVIDNDEDFFRRLHAYIISECVRYLKDIKNAGCDFFDLCDVDCDEITDIVLEDFGSTDYILYRLESEIRVQYITQKQNLLKVLHTYIEKNNVLQNDINCSLFGSANFHCIWEDVCTSVFNDKYKFFKDKINKPEWNIYDNNGKFKKNEEETLIPDIIVEEEMEDGKYFGIFDAKYYCIDIDENCNITNGQLGVGDIIKQYFYQISFKDYICNNKCKYIQNVFLFPDFVPAKNNKYSSISYVTMETFEKVIKDLQLGSGKIRLVWLDTEDMYEKYIKGKKIKEDKIFEYIVYCK